MADSKTQELVSALRRLADATVEAANRHLESSNGLPLQLLEDDRRAALGNSRYLDWAREIYCVRRLRSKHLPDVFGEPTWDLILDLYIAFLEGRKVTTKSACIGAHCATSTALRKILDLEAAGMLYREDDPIDKRLKWIALSKETIWAMNRLCEDAMSAKTRMKR
ncbi:MarR family transcriptional regulator [Novosphingobium sp. MW5]|nr:MarR family transcriptional regulator [Novosphingobium sp. MW5]